MARVFLALALATVSFTGLVSADQPHPAYFYPVDPSSATKPAQETTYEYSIIPSDQYADYPVTEYDPTVISIWNYIPSPVTALTAITSKAYAVSKYFLPNIGWMALGVALVIGLCAFTPYCTLIIEKPLSRKIRSLTEKIPYLDCVENFFSEAYKKYHEMQRI